MKVIFLLILTCAFVNLANSQNTIPVDTVEYARSKAYERNFSEADKLLTRYNRNSVDVNALRLHAQVLYWMKQFDRALAVQESAVVQFPEQVVLKLDYGRMLYELGKYQKAKILLNDFLATDKLHVEALIMLSYIDLWSGQINPAISKANKVLNQFPENEDALGILRQITLYRAPYIALGANFQSDDQPKTTIGNFLETGVYRSWVLSPSIKAEYNDFTVPDGRFQSWWVQASNKISLGRSFSLKISGGLFQHTLGSENNFITGRIGITQKLGPHFTAEAEVEKRPYQYTLASIRTPVIENFLAGSLGFQKKNWLAKAGHQVQAFQDNNKIFTSYAWIMAPLFIQSKINFHAGYAFAFADSYKNNFVSAQPISKIINSSPFNENIPGVFDPYFTPQNQIINSLLASLTISLSEKFRFSSRTSVGIYALADNPYLFLNKNPGNQFIIEKGYSQVEYTPIEWVNNLELKFSSKFSMQVNYTFQSLFFYTNSMGGLHVKYNFIHD